jgi:uncharacterized protein
MTFHQLMQRGLALGLVGCMLFASAAASPAQQHARGTASVWTLKGRKNTVYLAGSVHALPKQHAEFPAQLEQAYAAAETIVMEVDLDDLDPREAVQFITARGTLPADKSLEDVIGTEGYATVSRLADSLGLPEIAIQKLEPWAAAMVLTQMALVKSGFDPELGIEMQIVERAKRDRKPVDGLETVVEQLGIFDARNMDEQAKFLIDSANDVGSLPADLERLVAAWRVGDLQSLEKEFQKERAQAPQLYDRLLGERNRAWLPKIEALLDGEHDYLVVVGTLHFVGRDGLLDLLRRGGHEAVALPAVAR